MSIQRWAMVKNNVVINICLWDGLLTTWSPPEGVDMHVAPDHLGIGWTFENEQWVAPVPVIEEVLIVDSSVEQSMDKTE